MKLTHTVNYDLGTLSLHKKINIPNLSLYPFVN